MLARQLAGHACQPFQAGPYKQAWENRALISLELVLRTQVLSTVGLVEHHDGIWVGAAALTRGLGSHAKAQGHVCGARGAGRGGPSERNE